MKQWLLNISLAHQKYFAIVIHNNKDECIFMDVVREMFAILSARNLLTYWSLVIRYGDMDLSQHWLR